MKRLKRVLALTLAAVMLFTLGGCKKKTPEEVLEAEQSNICRYERKHQDENEQYIIHQFQP